MGIIKQEKAKGKKGIIILSSLIILLLVSVSFYFYEKSRQQRLEITYQSDLNRFSEKFNDQIITTALLVITYQPSIGAELDTNLNQLSDDILDFAKNVEPPRNKKSFHNQLTLPLLNIVDGNLLISESIREGDQQKYEEGKELFIKGADDARELMGITEGNGDWK